MTRLWNFLLDARVLTVLGLAALAAFLFLGAELLQLALVWAAIALGGVLLGWALWRAAGLWRARRKGQALEQALDQQAARVAAKDATQGEVQALRERMRQAIHTIKGSRLGQLSGSAAL